jgi:hypothetical protein
MKGQQMTENGTEVAEVSPSLFELSTLNSVDQALEYARANGDTVLAAELGDESGFEIVLDKSRLIGTRFVVVHVDPMTSKKFGDGIALYFITAGGFKGKLVDFSTGINQQVRGLISRNPNVGGIVCEHGVVESSYINDDGIAGVTYYLDTAPSSTGHID